MQKGEGKGRRRGEGKEERGRGLKREVMREGTTGLKRIYK